MAESKPTVAIISLGDMGSGLARLLTAQNYPVTTNVSGRSPNTQSRAVAAGAAILPTDVDLVSSASLILSVVPPRDAMATAQRVLDAITALPEPRTAPLYFADMNAISPSSLQKIAALFDAVTTDTLRFIDGSILGGPPAPPSKTSTSTSNEAEDKRYESWNRPLLPTSGPFSVASVSPHLAAVLNARHISPDLGAASGLKMCFASLGKGFAAIAVQAVTTAKRLGVLDDLRSALAEKSPWTLERVEKSVVTMAPKAYRWVREMEEISETHAGVVEGDGVFAPEYIFKGAAEVFRLVAEDTVLGQEKVGKRERGRNADEVADAVLDGVREKRRKKCEE
ncbi:6-phosphogluconate dehydrogenase [Immersiella caudata]|uniref:6-phosphogluconate dehydrogenase n=1 Tax=Immersiella caudata TaxID=314043 RepID=A0AA39XE30_9PEZI|nr:6-phosphogluconate dehydrogenase [Immersiella caudata]